MSETRRVQLVDAFTEEPMTGNPAGVLTDATGLTDDQMAAVANELGASETAFVRQSEDADRRLRYFSPESEVDLCGHATVAAMSALYDRAQITADSYTVETNVGVLDVEVEPDGTVWFTQSEPEISPVDLAVERVADALGLDEPALSEVGADLPLSRASTGLPFLMVPVSYFEQLSAVDPDMDAIAELCESADTQGLYAFTFDTLDRTSTLHGRAFVPRLGIPEDPVTGTASGAVCAYLRHHGALDQPDPLVCEQGHFLDRPGRVLVRTGHPPESGPAESDDGESGADAGDGDAGDDSGEPDESDRSDEPDEPDESAESAESSETERAGGLGANPTAPTVGGRAVTVLDGDLSIPDSDEDDIIEA
jgi:PhzF family phenazine biosynthesis protein